MTLTLDLHLAHLPRLRYHHYLESGAEISADGRYRYRLTRRWDDGPALMIVALHPGTAGAHLDDPTVRRDVALASGLGYAALTKLNLYAGRAAGPRELAAMDDPIGPDNDAYLSREAGVHDQIVFTWGTSADPARARGVASRLWRICRRRGGSLAVLGWTANSQPCPPPSSRMPTPLQCLSAGAHQQMLDVDPPWIGLLSDAGAVDDGGEAS
ncbi:DUF1643 domain-containing protein [Mycobacterium xenopi]|uniref:DUF1643 domain-containing protein n=1 Tax=Mycobacterium xenopi TaxID=1789 RepID=UPI000A158492|nr:DUF1643 domain-containing protein [Mycobacterium xenopi]ORX13064.1 hypothetical protein AWC32_15685 [Mycobacterium xenopi]SPX94937.1 Uncharacterized protein conserved in bacteria [Mycobacterium xenopi]